MMFTILISCLSFNTMMPNHKMDRHKNKWKIGNIIPAIGIGYALMRKDIRQSRFCLGVLGLTTIVYIDTLRYDLGKHDEEKAVQKIDFEKDTSLQINKDKFTYSRVDEEDYSSANERAYRISQGDIDFMDLIDCGDDDYYDDF